MESSKDGDGEFLNCLLHPCQKQVFNEENTSPVHIQFLEKSLKLDRVVDASEEIFKEEISDISSSDEDQKHGVFNGKIKNSYRSNFTQEEWEQEKLKFYNLKSIGVERSWLQEILLKDDSHNSSESDIDKDDLSEMLKLHLLRKKTFKEHYNPEFLEEDYSYYSSSLILEHDKYHDNQKKRKKSLFSVNKKPVGKKLIRNRDHKKSKLLTSKLHKQQIQYEKEMLYKRRKIWHVISKKDIPKVCRSKANTKGTSLVTLKKVAQSCQRERRKEALRSQRISKEAIPRARRMTKEMLMYWKKFDRVEKEHRKKAEKEAMEQRKQDEEMREMKRQQRKLNFLITQTELYAHFMGKKIKGGQDAGGQAEILKKLEDPLVNVVQHSINGGILVNNNLDDEYDCEAMKTKALVNAQNAVLEQEKKLHVYKSHPEKKTVSQDSFDTTFSLANPSLNSEKKLPQPKIFDGSLKTYQLKGMNWLINLYEQGINGILADEMGLGKTVQSISFLAYLAEAHDIWGPFMVVAPASTLHNWQQEFTKFLPQFKVLPYWGDPNDRKSLRKFWNQTSSFLTDSEKAPFHVLITSYQLVVQDVKYFQRIKWQYLILDEAHAIKSSSSLRWKILLGYNCRNRLLLTGTPIQNTMAELWALLHFIMPTLFDSHDEFNEWFSKDIESHASEKRPNLDQNQLSRLHMILKPFMLRRVKKDVENELSEKIEIKVICEMSSRQKKFYQAVKNKIMFEDLLQSTTTNSEKSTSLLMNLVMQFRKVCNHPELFERKEPSTGFYMKLPDIVIPKFFYRNGLLNELPVNQTTIYERMLLLWRSQHIYDSLNEGSSCFSFTRFTDIAPNECALLFRCLMTRIIYYLLSIEQMKCRKCEQLKSEENTKNHSRKYLTRRDLLIVKPCLLNDDEQLLFVRSESSCSGFAQSTIRNTKFDISRFIDDCCVRTCEMTYYPTFLTSYSPKVYSPPVEVYCSDRSAAYQYKRRTFGSDGFLRVLKSGLSNDVKDRLSFFYPPPLQGLDAIQPVDGWSKVKVPDRTTLLSDSGKLSVLDTLLTRMKKEGHRVLIYSQMTKMIDILEEFMNFRHHSYMRLDGSSKISDRRDMVNDFQNRNDIFAFLLSTRAGGLGINLTAADTVIFYDSDWNPTVDQQAMDRAHRLGQKRQVTVYRLVTKGTVEEKILNRAREKSEIQNIVISGGQFNKDVLRPKEVVSLLLDDVELEAKLKQRQAEKKIAEESGRRPGRKRKNPIEKPLTTKQMKTDDNTQAEVPETHSPNLSRQSSLDVEENENSGTTSNLQPRSNSPSQSSTNITTPNASRKRGRGRGRGGTRGRGKSKSGNFAKAAASAAAAAGAAAGYAAYGYSFHASKI